MVLEFSNFIIDIDVEKTRNFYTTACFVSDNCSCSGCRNFEKAVNFLPQEVISFFMQLGIDMKKVCEVYMLDANTDNIALYGGFYHACGKIISGESAWVQTDPTSFYFDEDKTHSITNDFRVSFQERCDLLKKEFPLPAIQLDISADIPWVLEEKNDFL